MVQPSHTRRKCECALCERGRKVEDIIEYLRRDGYINAANEMEAMYDALINAEEMNAMMRGALDDIKTQASMLPGPPKEPTP